MRAALSELVAFAVAAVRTRVDVGSRSIPRGRRAIFVNGSGLRLSHKFLLIAGLSNLPVLILGYYFVVDGLKDLGSIAKEREGIEYLQKIWPVFTSTVTADPGLKHIPSAAAEI